MSGGGTQQWSSAFAQAGADAVKIYDEVLVDAMFVPWAELLLDRLKPSSGESALDVAAGTGALTRVLAHRVGPTGRVIAADISPGMLAVNRAKGPVPGGAPIGFVETPAAPLNVESDAFDVLTCQHGFQFFPDKPAALAEMKRALRPGGRIGLAVWDRIEGNAAFAAIRDAIAEEVSSQAAAQYASGPWGLPGEEFARLFNAAGFDDANVTKETMEVAFESAGAMYDTLAASGIVAELAALGSDRLRSFRDRCISNLQPLVRDGKLWSITTSWIATGRALTP